MFVVLVCAMLCLIHGCSLDSSLHCMRGVGRLVDHGCASNSTGLARWLGCTGVGSPPTARFGRGSFGAGDSLRIAGAGIESARGLGLAGRPRVSPDGATTLATGGLRCEWARVRTELTALSQRRTQGLVRRAVVRGGARRLHTAVRASGLPGPNPQVDLVWEPALGVYYTF